MYQIVFIAQILNPLELLRLKVAVQISSSSSQGMTPLSQPIALPNNKFGHVFGSRCHAGTSTLLVFDPKPTGAFNGVLYILYTVLRSQSTAGIDTRLCHFYGPTLRSFCCQVAINTHFDAQQSLHKVTSLNKSITDTTHSAVTQSRGKGAESKSS